MIYFIICAVVVTILAVMLCAFSAKQQRKEDEYVGMEKPEVATRERRDWDILNQWDEE